MTAPDMPTAFPYEGPAYEIPRTRPARRYRIELDDWEAATLADAYTPDDQPAPPPYDPGDRIMRCVLAVWLACAVVFLLAAVGYHERGGPWYAGSIGVALTAAAVGWAATAWTDRKAVR